MSDLQNWLGKKEEVEFGKYKFRGKLAGKAWKYTQSLDGLIRTRIIILSMSVLVFWPIAINYFVHGLFIQELLIERLVYAAMFILSGFLFNKFRIASIIIACVPTLLILANYLIAFDYRKVGFFGAILFLILAGVYYHIQLKKWRKELEPHLLENHMIE